jgi:hypothetical protein
MLEFTELFQSNHYSVSDMVNPLLRESWTFVTRAQAAGLAELFLHRRLTLSPTSLKP